MGIRFRLCRPAARDGNKLICLVGGDPNAMVVAFDKKTGKELWRQGASEVEPGYAPPRIIEQAGKRVAELRPVVEDGQEMRPMGLCAGEFHVPDDFDAPLPDDVVRDFENP